MTIMAALAQRYERLALTGDVVPEGYEIANVGFTVVLDKRGNIVDVDDERRQRGQYLQPRKCAVPSPRGRTTGIVSYTLCDNAEYVFRIGDDPKVPARHAAFVEHHRSLLRGIDDDGARALLAFLDHWTPDRYLSLKHALDMTPSLSPPADSAQGKGRRKKKPAKEGKGQQKYLPAIAFRLEDDVGFIHDRPAIRAALEARAAGADQGTPAMCLVSGRIGPVARLHPPIKGVRGTLKGGAALVSYNERAYLYYGLEQGANAPVSRSVVAAYVSAANGMLTPSHYEKVPDKHHPDKFNEIARYDNCFFVGDITVLYWAEHGTAEAFARAVLAGDVEEDLGASSVTDVTETDKVKAIISSLAEGKPLRDAAPDIDPDTRVYVLGLQGHGAKISVAFWRDATFGDFARALQQHWEDLRLDPPLPKPLPVWRLLAETALERKDSNVKPGLAGEVLRSILTGSPYPPALAAQLVLRIDAERSVNRTRAAMIKACLCRLNRKEYVPVSLDFSVQDPAYRMGCLFAVLERLQRVAQGNVNANIRDRFMNKASNTPAAVMPVLLDGAGAHNKVIRTRPGGGGLAEWFEQRIGAALEGIDHMPTILAPLERGRFYLGYYQQKTALSMKAPKEIETVEAAADIEASTGK